MNSSDETIAALRSIAEEERVATELSNAVREGIETEARKAKTFTTHSQSFRGRLHAELQSINETLADLAARRQEIDDQIEDAMLTHSMIAHALDAGERGAKR